MDARSLNDDAYLSDDEGFEGFTANAQVSASINQVKSISNILLNVFKAIKNEYEKISDESKKILFLTQTFNAIGVEKIQSSLTQAHIMLKLVEQNEEILESINMTIDQFMPIKNRVLELEALFNSLWEESMTASIKFFAKKANDAKPEELVSSVGLFSVKPEVSEDSKVETFKNKKTL